MRQPVLDYHQPSQKEAIDRATRRGMRVAAFLFRTGARGGAVAQVCTVFIFGMLARSPANVALIFWRREALDVTVMSALWLLFPGQTSRWQPALFLALNGFGCAIAMLLPVLNS